MELIFYFFYKLLFVSLIGLIKEPTSPPRCVFPVLQELQIKTHRFVCDSVRSVQRCSAHTSQGCFAFFSTMSVSPAVSIQSTHCTIGMYPLYYRDVRVCVCVGGGAVCDCL